MIGARLRMAKHYGKTAYYDDRVSEASANTRQHCSIMKGAITVPVQQDVVLLQGSSFLGPSLLDDEPLIAKRKLEESPCGPHVTPM